MKKRNYLLILAAVFVAILVVPSVFISCSDDENVTISVNEEVVQSGIIAEVQGGSYSFKVNSNGKWSASLPEDCDWAELDTDNGNGDGAIDIYFDSNFSGTIRSSVIEIITENQTLNIPIKQKETKEGIPLNDDSDGKKALINDITKCHLGMGVEAIGLFEDKSSEIDYYDYITDGQVINDAGVQKYMKGENEEDGNLMRVTTHSQIKYEKADYDTLIKRDSHLKIGLEFNVSYSMFKFNIKGEFIGKESKSGNSISYAEGGNYPSLEASLNPLEVLAIIEDEPNFQKTYTMLSRSFNRARLRLQDLCKNATNRNDEINEAIHSLKTNFGSGVITRSRMGGTFGLNLLVDSAYVHDSLAVHDAEVDFSMQTVGIVNNSLDLKIKGEYHKRSASSLRHSQFEAIILGGSLPTGSKIVKALTDVALAGFTDDYTKSMGAVADALDAWVATIPEHYEFLSLNVAPIWKLFDDKTSKMIEEWFQENYGDTEFMKRCGSKK